MQHIQIILGTKFHLSFVFSDQICPNVAVLVQNRKNEHHHRVQLIQINPDTNFRLKNRKFWLFGLNLLKKIFSSLKRKKVKFTNEFSIFEVVKISNFILNRQYWFFGQNLSKKVEKIPLYYNFFSLNKKFTY